MRFEQKNDFRAGQVDRVLIQAGILPHDRAMLKKALLDVGARQPFSRPVSERREREIRDRLDKHLGEAIVHQPDETKVAIKREADALVKRTDRIGRVLGTVWIGALATISFGGLALLSWANVANTYLIPIGGAVAGGVLLGFTKLICNKLNEIEACAHRLKNEIEKHLKSEPQREQRVSCG